MEIAKPYGILFLLKILQVNVLLSKKENWTKRKIVWKYSDQKVKAFLFV